MGERAVTDVVHQNGCLYGFGFAVENKVSFGPQLLDGLAHQVECPERVLETGVLRPGIDHGGDSHLPDAVEPLEQGMADDVIQQSFRDGDESEYRIVDDLLFEHLSGKLSALRPFRFVRCGLPLRRLGQSALTGRHK